MINYIQSISGLGTAAEVGKIPKSDAAVSWNATALADLKSKGNVVSLSSVTQSGIIIQHGTSGTPDIIICSTSDSDNTFGAWVTVEAVAGNNNYICVITVTPVLFPLSTLGIIEIGTGAPGAESTKIRFSWAESSIGGVAAPIPMLFTLSIPKAPATTLRIAARVSCSNPTAVRNVAVGVSFYNGLEV